MLAIVATLHEFKNVLLGYPVTVHADHVNLAHDTIFKTSRVMNWRLKIEEFVPSLNWIPGTNNPIANLLSRHPISVILKDNPIKPTKETEESFLLDSLPEFVLCAPKATEEAASQLFDKNFDM